MSKLFEAALEGQDNTRMRAGLMQKYEMGRSNLLLAVILTGVNILLPIFGVDIYMLFSIFTPTFIASLAMILCGKYPAEYYTEMGLDGIMFYDDTVFFALLVVAVVITLVFLVLWLLSRGGRVVWMIVASALMVVDGVMIFVLGGLDMYYALDIIFHAWVLYAMISGIVSYYKLKNLPEDSGDILDAFAAPPTDIE